MNRQIGKLIVVCLCWLTPLCQAAVTAHVDKTSYTDVELIRLIVRTSDNAFPHAPDFSALETDFELASSVSTSEKTNIQFGGGRNVNVRYKDHIVSLRPKRTGTLIIPPIRAGNEQSEPIILSINQQSSAQRDRMRQYVFFETEVDSNSVYVQGQLIYSVKLYYSEAIGGDFPQAPALENAVVETIENEKRYEAVVNGRRYYVLEKRYAIFPQRSGDLIIAGENFRGYRGRGGVFGQRQAVYAQSDAHTVTVQRIPAEFSGTTWLPAKALGVRETWAEEPPVFRVGEPVNRTLTLSAIGQTDALLPQLGDMQVENAKIYADPPTSENRVTPDGITALQQTSVGIVPTETGPITLPEIRIPWWNTQTDREEIAVIPAATFEVLPAVGGVNVAPTVEVPLSEYSSPTIVAAPANPYWQWAAIVFAFLWILASWQWLMLSRRVKQLESASASRFEAITFDDPDETRQFKALKQACERNRAADAHRQLFLWAKARFPEITSITHLTRRFSDLQPIVEALETHLYSTSEGTTWRGAELLSQVNVIRSQKTERNKDTALEAELNPV